MKFSSFKFANIFQLVKGSVLAQLVFVLVTPLLTRIYTPEQMGIFGVFFAAVLVLSRFASLRYDLAIPLPRTDAAAFHLIAATFFASIIFSSIALSLNRYLLNTDTFSYTSHTLQRYDVVLALGVVSFVLFESLSFWYTRRKQFNVVGNGKIITSVTLATLQLVGYFFSNKLIVLLVAYPVSMAIGIAYMLSNLQNIRHLFNQIRLSTLKKVTHRYREFPLVSTWTTATMEISQSLPLVVITILFGNAEAGYFFLARRIGLVPTSVIGRAISLVNFSDMVDFKKDNTLKDMLAAQIRQLQLVTLVPATILALLAPDFSSYLLGESWRDVGVFVQLMTPYVYIKLIFSPMNAINYIQGWQRIALVFEVLSTTISCIAMYWFASHGEMHNSIFAYFTILALLNVVYRSYLMTRIDMSIRELLSPTLLQLVIVIPIVLVYFLYF